MKKEEYYKMFNFEDSHFWFLGKRFFIRTILDKYIPKKKLLILDLGCGTGGISVFLKKYGRVIGLEKNKIAIHLAKKRNLKIIQQDIQKPLPFSNNSFDLITILDVLYHKNIKNIDLIILIIKLF